MKVGHIHVCGWYGFVFLFISNNNFNKQTGSISHKKMEWGEMLYSNKPKLHKHT